MNDLLMLLVIAAVAYFMFRKSGLAHSRAGGSREASNSKKARTAYFKSLNEQSQTIDLKKTDYTILPSDPDDKSS